MQKNVSGQKLKVYAVDRATGGPKTGDAANITAYVMKDNGALTALTDTSATEVSSTNAPGLYTFDLTQAETNADVLNFTGKSSSTGIDIVPQEVQTVPANFGALAIDTNGRVRIQADYNKNVAKANIHFVMTDSTTHNPATAKTVTATRCIDNGSFASGTLGSVTEVSNGLYRLDAAAADLNGDSVTLKLSASGCDDLFISLTPLP